ncbi:MAG: DUF456 domain-containing protein [Deinococcus sp.]
MSAPFVVFLIAWLVGMVGTFVPLVPATLVIFLGALVATLMDGFQPWPDLPFLLSLAALTVAITLVDNLASAWRARRWGGSKQAAWGALAGGLVGLFIPFGLVLGPLAGALLAELVMVRRPPLDAVRSAWGTLVGLLGGIAAKAMLHLLLGLYAFWRLWDPARSALS